MVPAGNKAKHLLSVNHTTKTIHDFHMGCAQFNNGWINKGSRIKESDKAIEKFAYKDTRSGIKLQSLRKRTIYQKNHVNIPGPQ